VSNAIPTEGNAFPKPALRPVTRLDRLAAFRVTYAALFAFVLLYVFSVKGVEQLLDWRFRDAVSDAIRVEGNDASAIQRMQDRLDQVVRESRWARWGGVRITAIVLGADGATPLYIGGRWQRPPPPLDPAVGMARLDRILPATADVMVSVPHNSLLANGILVGYAALLVTSLFAYNRRLARLDEERFEAALAAREAAAERAARIEKELAEVRRRLADEAPETPAEREIQSLREERARLQQQLDSVTHREQDVSGSASRARQLDEERRALEELLDEATRDLASKDEEIRLLQGRLRRASRLETSARPAREVDQLGRRLRALYRNLEIDDRVLRDLVDLGDETLKLRAEESLMRLSEDSDAAGVRRKVGGLPPHLSVFELGFGGKGRIYYTRGRQRRHRVLAIGAKNTQKSDLEYLSRLPRES
jgi:hypothetical protein